MTNLCLLRSERKMKNIWSITEPDYNELYFAGPEIRHNHVVQYSKLGIILHDYYFCLNWKY